MAAFNKTEFDQQGDVINKKFLMDIICTRYMFVAIGEF